MQIIEANLNWQEDDEEVYAYGLLTYLIDLDNELAVFQGEKCMAIRECNDLEHAIAIAEAFEREAIRNKERGTNWRGNKGALM